MKFIKLIPVFSPFSLVKKKQNNINTIFPNKKICYLHLGRGALRLGLKYLNLSTNDRILVPTYICAEVPKSIKEIGIKVDYYQILKDLTPNFNDVQKKITPQTKAILMVHYFGFPQPIKKFQNLCKKYHLKLIEDCAHTFGGKHFNKYLGTFGDIAFFSLKKLFPLSDGGILIIPKNNIISDVPMIKTRSRAVVSLFLDWLIFLTGWLKLNLLRKIKQGKNNESIKYLPLGISHFNHWLWQKYNWQKAGQKRKSNYIYLSKLLSKNSKIKLLFPDLPEQVVPYVLPIITQNKTIKNLLHKKNVLADTWPTLPDDLSSDKYKTVFRLAKNILCLPIHQGLNKKKLRFIAKIVLKEYM